MPDSRVANRAMEAVTGQPVEQVVADGPAVDERRAEVAGDQVLEVVEELDGQRAVPAQRVVLRRDLGRGGG